MSELKAHNVVATADVNPEVVDNLGCTEWLAYDKEEVDKVFRRLKARLSRKGISIQQLEADKNHTWRKYCCVMKEIRHHKYKRCLDKAKWCYDRWICAYNSSRLQKARFYAKWQKRWEKYAEYFKVKAEEHWND